MKPFNKGLKNDDNDAEAIAEAALRPNLKTVFEKTQEQLDLQALHRVRSRLVLRRSATMNQIRAFLLERGVTVRKSVAALRRSLDAILDNRSDEISLRMRKLNLGLQQDWFWLNKRIDMTTAEIKDLSTFEESCRRLMTIPGIGLLISTAVVAAIGKGEAKTGARFCSVAWTGSTAEQHRRADHSWPDNKAWHQILANVLCPSRAGDHDAAAELE